VTHIQSTDVKRRERESLEHITIAGSTYYVPLPNIAALVHALLKVAQPLDFLLQSQSASLVWTVTPLSVSLCEI
jgi:hypothetical protein